MQYYLPFLFDLSKYSMPFCFFARPNEIQLDLTNLTSSRWKHINLMYKVEKRMQLKTSGTWNDIWWPVTTQPGQWQSWPGNAPSLRRGRAPLHYQGKNLPPAYSWASQATHVSHFWTRFFSFVLTNFTESTLRIITSRVTWTNWANAN